MVDDRQERFMALLRPIQRQLESFIGSMTRDRDASKDLLQDTIVAMWLHFDTIRDHSTFKSYAFTIASNKYKRQFVRARIFGVFTDELHDTLASSSPSPEQSTDVELVKRALLELPWKYRQALILYEMNDMTIEEVRRIQGGTSSGVKVRLLRARRMLAQRLGAVNDLSDVDANAALPASPSHLM